MPSISMQNVLRFAGATLALAFAPGDAVQLAIQPQHIRVLPR